MSEPESIVPSGIPQFTGDLDSLDHDAALLNAEAGAFRDAGAGIHSHFQGAAAFYKAPEADQLFATTAPVAAKTATFADNLEKVSGALSAYSQEVRPLAKKLEDLQRQAFAFTASIEGDDKWRRDETKRDRNDGLKHEVQATLEAFYAAEITCHNKITALVGGTKLVLGRLSGGQMLPKGTSAYGASADDLDHLDQAPWGNYAEPEYTGLSWMYHQGKSFVWDGFIVDGIWGTVKGIDILLGSDGWDAAGEAWKGLAKVATGVVLMITPATNGMFMTAPASAMPKWFRESRTALKETGKALIAYDEWGKNPARAAGGVTFNVLTTVFSGGAGTAAKGGAIAKTVSVLGKVGRVVDPMTYVFSAGKYGVGKVGDLFATLKTLNSGAYNDILSGTGHLQPDGTYAKFADDVPVVKGDVIEWPNGARLDTRTNKVYKPNGLEAPAHAELSQAQLAQLKSSLPHAAETTLPGAKSPVLVAAAGERAGHVENAAGHSTGTAHPGNGSHPIGGGGGTHNTPSTGGHPADSRTPSGGSGGSHTPSGGGGHGTRGDAGHDTGSHSDGPETPGGAGDADGPFAGDGGGTGDGLGSGSGNPERQPGVILEGDRIGQQPSGPMAPEQEAAVTAALKDVKVPPVDQGRMLTQLRKSEYGAAIAEYISSGRFADIPMFKEPKGLLFQVKQKGMIPAVHQAMEHAAELQAKGIKNIEFELKLPEDNLDLDVLVRSDGRIEYGAQLKDVDSVAGIKSAVRKIAEKQLGGEEVNIKVGILDIKGLRGELTERDIQAVQRAADSANAYFELKFDDGSVTIYPTNATKR